MERLAELPKDMIFFTQITMEAAEDPEFLDAMRKAQIKGALVGVEAVTPEGLKAVYKDFNCAGEKLVKRLQNFREHGVHVLGSFIFGLPTDREHTFEATSRSGGEGRADLRAVRDADAFRRHGRFRALGKGTRRECAHGGWHSADPVLADSAGKAAEDVHAASDDEFRRTSAADARCLGRLLQPACDLEALELHAESESRGWHSSSSPSCTGRCMRRRYRHR